MLPPRPPSMWSISALAFRKVASTNSSAISTRVISDRKEPDLTTLLIMPFGWQSPIPPIVATDSICLQQRYTSS